jgi:hypothetical protein
MAANSAFQITYQEVELLRDFEFVRLVNDLILAERHRLHLPTNAVQTTLAINDPDGGADALTDNTGGDSTYFPLGRTAWQFKKTWPTQTEKNNELERELQKPAVQEVFQSGGNYILVVGKRMTPTTHQKREAQLTVLAQASGCTGTVRLLDANLVAIWASVIPAARLSLRQPLEGFITVDEVLRDPVHRVDFTLDPAREQIIAAIRTTVFAEIPTAYYARVEGDAGIGKTRLVLELVKGLGLSSVVLYKAEMPSNEFFTWCLHNPQIDATLVIDECEDAQAAKLETWTDRCGGRVRVLTIGPSVPPAHTHQQTYVLTLLERAAVEHLIQAVAPKLDDMQVRRIAELTQGYLKMTLAVAEAVAAGTTSLMQMRDARHIRREIAHLLIPDRSTHVAMTGIALLTHLGWLDEVSVEGQAVAEFLGLPWNALQTALGPPLARGLVVRRGRYWYVSPELLALWLAAEFWEQHAHRVKELLDQLPIATSRDAFLRRLSQLGDVPGVRSVLEELLDTHGFFRDIDTLDDHEASRLFAVLANGAPMAGLATLSQIITSTPLERLRQFGPGRRQVLWTLEKLLPDKDRFYEAARIVRRLAEAENESVGNNATGIWKNLFLTFLGQTEVPALDRLMLIREAATAESPALRLLAIQALETALQGYESTAIGPQIGIVPRPHWRPKTWDEVRQVKREALTILQQHLADSDIEVRKAAHAVLLYQARAIVTQGLANDVIMLLNTLQTEDEEEAQELGTTIQAILKHESEHLTEDQRQVLTTQLTQLYGTSLVDRIKRYTGPRSWVDWPDANAEPETDPDQIAARLAEEALDRLDEVRPILPWLASPKAVTAFAFMRRLGQLDADHTWLEPLLEAVQDSHNAYILGIYLAGRAEAGEESWRERLLDEWAANPDRAWVVFDVTRIVKGSNHAAARILALIDRGWLDPTALQVLRYGAWCENLSDYYLVELLNRLLVDESAATVESALLMIEGWLRAPDRHLETPVKEVAWRVLEQPHGWGASPGLAHLWEEIARRLMPDDPVRLARLALQTIIEEVYHMQRVQLLEEALEIAPREVWNVIGEVLLSESGSYRIAWAIDESPLLTQMPFDILRDWIEAHGGDAALRVAQCVKPAFWESEPIIPRWRRPSIKSPATTLNNAQLTPLIRYLLREHGEKTGSTLYANFLSGGWTGSHARYLEGKLAIAQTWLRDEDVAVQNWARKVVNSINSDLKEVQLHEEEEDLGL